MLKFLRLTVALAALSASQHLAAQPHDTPAHACGEFSFVQISDPQLGFREESGFAEGEALLLRTLDMIDSLRPSFVIVTGDMVNSSADTAQLAAYKRLISRFDGDIPFYHIPGNHDTGRWSERRRDAYLQRWGYNRFAFEYDHCAFVGIDSCPIKDGAAEAEQEQYEWLERSLDSLRECRLKFVFVHCPIVLKRMDEAENYSNFPMEMRERYISLLKRLGVDALFAGHLHNTSYACVEGIPLYTCGPSGKPLGSGVSGLHLITVRDATFDVQYLPLH